MTRSCDPAGAPVPAGSSQPVELDVLVRGLTKRFGEAVVLKGVNLAIPKGQAVALIGSNGAGKSTLLRCMLRLVDPSDGCVMILGQEVTSLKHAELRSLRSRVGFVFQRHNLVPRFSALTNVLHGAQARGKGPRLWHQAFASEGNRLEALRCLEMVGLSHVAERRVDTLSGGQSQRVAIARALMQRPKLMMADEPVASLDPSAGREVMELFVDLIRREGITLVFTSHSLSQALEYSDRLVALKNGCIDLDGAAADLDEIQLRTVYDAA
ncbi:MAG: phosphonate ABC transporter ATP-binding protein [Oceanidesulfovibrio sp.]